VKGYSPGSLDYGGNAAFSQFQDGEKDPRSASLTTAEAADTLDAVNAKVLDMTRGEAKEKAEELRDAEGELTLNEFDNHVTRAFWEQYTSGASSVDRLNKTAFGTDARREKEALRSALNKQEGRIEAEDIDTWAITIHASKGMEADDVVVYDGISRTIQQGMRESDRTHRNEYRTWYVALSRGKKRIHVMRNAFEWTNPIIPEDLGA
jgi:DNA helicase-2/ATP-dependent DNA helicase PcrA